ncbi:MAG: phytanoyl-CoA dioxygenase [Thiotrichales bacterium]|nr:phytanoyl-CoA dioxygenase [Thiotrichales bacterium]
MIDRYLKLSPNQVSRFNRDGFVHPINVMTPEQAYELCRRFELAQAKFPDELSPFNRNNAHLSFTCVDEIVHHDGIVDAVSDLLGENVLATGTVLFVKEPRSDVFVSWHQDFTYMGFEPHDGVSAWLALTPSTVETGCMRMIPGSHLMGQLPHRDSNDDDNILSRGQSVENVDVCQSVAVELLPGQMSLHHPRVVHGSEPNRSDQRRIGIVVQAYIPPHVRQVSCESFATLVRGQDVDSTYELLPRPHEDMLPQSVELRRRVNTAREAVLYEGTDQTRQR